MKLIIALKLFSFVVGVALSYASFILIRRHRRIGKLEFLFLSLVSTLFLWNLCNFLSLLFETTTRLSQFILSLIPDTIALAALGVLPSLLLHLHLELRTKYLRRSALPGKAVLESAIYLPLLFYPAAFVDFLENYPAQSILASTDFARPFAAWFGLSLLGCSAIQWQLRQEGRSQEERRLFGALTLIFSGMAILGAYPYLFSEFRVTIQAGGYLEAWLMLWFNIPSALVGYYFFRYNFFGIAVQRSIGYSFAGILMVLVYLLGTRWVRDFLESTYGLPGLIVEAGMILLLLAFIQPLKHRIDTSLNSLFSGEIAKFQSLATQIDEVSRSTVELKTLLTLIEDRLRDVLKLSFITLVVYPEAVKAEAAAPRLARRVFLSKGGRAIGEIQLGDDELSPEQEAALRFLATQIVAAIENCRIAESKILLERELAERDRLVLSKKMSALGQLVAGVVHELNTPLGVINNTAALSARCLDKISQALKNCRHLDDLRRSGEFQNSWEVLVTTSQITTAASGRISRLVGSLKSFARLDEATFQKVDIHEGLESTLILMEPDFKDRVQVIKKFGEIPLVYCYPSELNQVFMNLLTNAAAAIRGEGTITIRTFAENGQVQIQISDTGIGISPDRLRDLFNPSFSREGPRVKAALGLFTCYNIMQKHQGQIGVVSELNKGTTVTISVPGDLRQRVESSPNQALGKAIP